MTTQEKKRILLINDHIHFGGGGDATLWHERRIFESQGHEVYTFSQATDASIARSKRDTIYIESSSRIAQKAGKYIFNFGVFLALRKLLKRIKPDFVHLHLSSKYPASIYAALCGYPVVQTLHGPNHFCATSWGNLMKNSKPCELGIGVKCFVRGCIPLWQLPLVSLLYRLSKFFAKRSVKLFLGPSRQISAAAEKVGFGPTQYLPLCVDEIFDDLSDTRDDEPPTVIFVGAIAKQKGVDVLLEAFRLVLKDIPDARLIYAGRGDLLPLLKKNAGQWGIQDNVDFLGFVDHDQIADVYRKGHVFAMPSVWNEQFGLVGLEALICGLPCVASDVGGIGEWLKDGQWGYLVPPRDPVALSQKLIILLKDKELGESFAEKGREFVLNEYSIEKFRDNILGLLDKS